MSFAANATIDASAPDWADATEQRVLDAAISLTAGSRLPWGARLVTEAAKAVGLSPVEADLLLPGGAKDLAALLSRRHDQAALAQLAALGDTAQMKIRDKIRIGVETRLDVAAADEAAVRRASLFLTRPDNAALALSLAWESADRLWRWAGDTATDENHYSKRAILAGLLTSTLAVRLAAGAERAEAYLAARVENVMGFEKWKAKLPQPSEGLATVASWLGGLRYRTAAADHERVNPTPADEGG